MGDEIDSEILLGILNELRWDTRVKPTEVGVEVTNGVVTLTGEVSTMLKKMAAEEAVNLVRGVRSVQNKMTVRGTKAGPSAEDLAASVHDAFEWDTFTPLPNSAENREIMRDILGDPPSPKRNRN